MPTAKFGYSSDPAKPADAPVFKVLPAPSFSGGGGQPSLATIYFAHYQRLMAVVDAARTENLELIRIAVAHQDRHGAGDKPS